MWAVVIIKCSVPVFLLTLCGLGLRAYEGFKQENDVRFLNDFEAYFKNTFDDDFDSDLAL